MGSNFLCRLKAVHLAWTLLTYKDRFQWIIFRENWPEDVSEIAVYL